MEEQYMTLPLIAMREDAVLPGCLAHFDAGRPETIRAFEQAMLTDEHVFIIAQREFSEEIPTDPSEYQLTGCTAIVKQIVRVRPDILRVVVEPEVRGHLHSVEKADGYYNAIVIPAMPYPPLDEIMEEAMVFHALEAVGRFCSIDPKMGRDLQRQAEQLNHIAPLLKIVANHMPLSYEAKQDILDAPNYEMIYEEIMGALSRETGVMMIRAQLQQKLKQRVDENQRKYVLREQIQMLREELGEDTTDHDVEEFKKTLETLEASDEVKEQIAKEIERYAHFPAHSPEISVSRGYIETLLALPWDKASEDNTDLSQAAAILERDHYGLEEPKERVLEFLAVRGLTKKGKSPIMCLVGPPGTGKTSIARSVAEALGKKYIRISLGGVRDEAEIRGHRRTYVGAMPGRIAQELKKAGVKNPLILFDEIDKTGSDYRGDTASAMLEILDAEQNQHFSDHYVEIPIDLSEVLFLTTANDAASIPGPLRDRMELIEVSGYSQNEKMHIAKEHLIGKQRKANGLTSRQLTFTDNAIEEIIQGYTREAGVRALERVISSVCRKVAKEIYEGKKKSVRVGVRNLKDYLGNPRYSIIAANQKPEVGIVRGLAWTSVGGVTLQIEVNVMPGKGEIRLTGQLGDVMKESAQAGITYIRSLGEKAHVPEDFFAAHDIHIHIPEGAVPKDGPSAGITMATAIYSAVTQIPVRADVAMTGEITLRGRVLPIGGLKEKLLAAKMAGIQTVLIPKKNERDLEEISEEIKGGLVIRPVSLMKEVLAAALVKKD